jgi:hypothetical protein
LHGLDLDRFDVACAQLAEETLEQAGGAAGCVRRLSRARGTRIRYRIDEAETSLLGVTIYFRTQAAGRAAAEIRQVMLVVTERHGLRILAVQPNPHPTS